MRDPATGRPRTVQELMRRNFISVPPEASLFDAYNIMKIARLRLLPVVQDGRLVGILTFRDLLLAYLGRAEEKAEPDDELRRLPVQGIMLEPPDPLGPDAGLDAAAWHLCANETGCLPVVESTREGPRLIGLVTERDLLRAAYEAP